MVCLACPTLWHKLTRKWYIKQSCAKRLKNSKLFNLSRCVPVVNFQLFCRKSWLLEGQGVQFSANLVRVFNPFSTEWLFGNFLLQLPNSNDLANKAGKYRYVHIKPPFCLLFMKQNGYFSTQCGAV